MVVIASSWDYQQSPAFAADRAWYDALHPVDRDRRLTILGEPMAELVVQQPTRADPVRPNYAAVPVTAEAEWKRHASIVGHAGSSPRLDPARR